MKWQAIIMFTLILLLTSTPAYAMCCQPGTDCNIIEQCPGGSCGTCTLTLYNQDGTLNTSQSMTSPTANTYLYNLTQQGENYTFGRYPYTISCDTGDYCVGDCELEYKQDCEEKGMLIIGIMIGIPLFMSILFFLISLWLEKEEHPALKKFFMLLTFIGVFQAYNYAVISLDKYYNFPELVNGISGGLTIFGMIFFVVVAYFAFDFTIEVFHLMAGKKRKTGEY